MLDPRSVHRLTGLSLALVLGAPAFAGGLRPLEGAALARLRQEEPARIAAAQRHLESLRPQLGLGELHGFRTLRGHTDELGQTHVRFQQEYRGLKVWGAQAVVHLDADGRALAPTLALMPAMELDVQPGLDASEALAIGGRGVQGTYTAKPRTELVVYPVTRREVREGHRGPVNAADMVTTVERYALAWHLHLVAASEADPAISRDLLVDAHTGAVLKAWDSLETAGATGTGHSQYSGNVTLNTNSLDSGYELRDTTRGTLANPTTGGIGNVTYNLAGVSVSTSTGSPAALGPIFTDADGTWGDGQNYVTSGGTADNAQTAAVDAHYGLQATWDYYKNVHGRNGIDGQGTSTYSRVHFSTRYSNAFWADECFCMSYGDGGTGTTVLTALDVAGHEMSHGVCSRTADLTYDGESGGLNESNSDINGTMVEFYVRGFNATGSVIGNTGGNWTIGEQLGDPLRYFYKPSLDGLSPDAWSPTVGGLNVHYSSGPNNRMFYFLSQGTGADADHQSTFLPGGMTGVGNDKAARIWYRNLSTYLTSGSTYLDARHGAVKAAQDLYGYPSAEYDAVQNAFAAINVGVPAGAVEDFTAPTVGGLGVAGSSGTVTLSATAADNVAVARVDFFVDGVFVGSDTSAPYSLQLDSTQLPNGGRTLTAQAWDTNGNGSAVSAGFAFSLSNSQSQGLLNPGFEADYAGWTPSANVSIESRASVTHSGNKAAWLGGYGQANTDDFYQAVEIPSNTGTVVLEYWLRVSTAETAGGAATDTLKVQIRDNAGAILQNLATYSNTDALATPAYVQHTADLSAYKGQTVRVAFAYTEDAQNFTSFRIDDVKVNLQVLQVQVAVPSATATVKKGASKTFTATVTGSSNTAVTWSVQEGAAGGTITSGGVYTAPATPGTYHVVATSAADNAKTATITVQVTNEPNLDGQGVVDGLDMGRLAAAYSGSGNATSNAAADMDGDGDVDDTDIDLFLASFGN